ncbi:hypothetical protein CICLE_v10004518mg [Citrus x clementina]|uniref:PGG domain-containing protein n=2 Tax=Citrus TaxID=2706 RepID=V4S8W9_CITCL|nr:ankyrin-1 [Citrus x clementina]ESR33351.1 hypothetical protein CICLE_v10004518mg [Citrus x clementina]
MDRKLFEAAAKGDIEPFREIARDELESIVTDVMKNTVLHVNIMRSHLTLQTEEGEISSESTEFVEQILDLCPSLLFQANAKGDSPLHLAAKKGHAAIVEFLIVFANRQPIDLESGVESAARQILKMTNEEQNTPLHEAVRLRRVDVVKILIKADPHVPYSANRNSETPLYMAVANGSAEIVAEILQNCPESAARQMLEKTNEEQNTPLHEAVRLRSVDVAKILIEADPHVPYSANRNSETPLYMAAANGSVKIVAKILQKCPSPAHEGPDGKTALHAAVYTYPTEVIKQLLEKKRSLTAVRDKYGWTPLHHAAYSGRELTSKLLLERDKSAAFIGDKDRNMTALHLAAARGHIGIVNEIISSCPSRLLVKVDERGWNFLHFAMVSLDIFQLSRLLIKHPIVRSSCLLSKDVDGNTPLHVVAAVCRLSPRVAVLPFLLKVVGGNDAVNNHGISVQDVKGRGFPELEQEIQELSKNVGRGQYPNGILRVQTEKEPVDEEALKEMQSLHTVVAALIATVTFAAGFTLPGGYWGKEGPIPGTPILIKNAGFRAFVVSDVIAMVLSVSAIFIYFLTPAKTLRQTKFLSDMPHNFIMVSLLAMVVAFITGTYAVLAPSAGLSVATCVLGSSFILFAFANTFMLARGLYQRMFGNN